MLRRWLGRVVVSALIAVGASVLSLAIHSGPAFANGTHCTVYGPHAFDGAQSDEYPTDLQGAQAYIGGFNTPTLCNPAATGEIAASSAWAMFASTTACTLGFAQTGVDRTNNEPDGTRFAAGTFLFAEQVSCTGTYNMFRFVSDPSPTTTYCYTAAHSYGAHADYFRVGTNCTTSTDLLGGYAIPDNGLYVVIRDWTAVESQYYGEIFDYSPSDGNGGESLDTSDSTCGTTQTSSCNLTSLQLRNTSGVWFNSTGSYGQFGTSGTGHCGLGQIGHSETSYSIWTSYSSC